MKKILFTLCLAAAALTTFAQDKSATFGIKAGANFSKFNISVDGSSVSASTGSLTSFHVGAFGDFKVSDAFSIQPALLFTQLGGKTTLEDDDQSIEGKTTLNYLQVPVNAVYWAPAGSGKFFIGAGPFVGYALSGKDKASGNFDGQTVSESQDVEFGEDGYKRANFGVGAIAGYKLSNGLSLNVGYDLGLSSVVDAEGGSVKTQVFNVSLGFSF